LTSSHLGADGTKLDIIAHLFEDLFPGKFFLKIRVKIKLLDNFPELDPGEYLLGQGLDPLIGKPGYRGFDKLLGNLLFLN